MLLAALRSVTSLVALDSGSLLDRLLLLEGAVRAGAPAAPLASALLCAQQEATRQVDDQWQSDVPHAVILAQLMAIQRVRGGDIPGAWRARLAEASDHLAGRQSQFSVTSDPLLAATLVRGLSAAGLKIPETFLTALAQVAESGTDVQVLAEVAVSLGGHRPSRDLGLRAAQRATSIATGETTADAVACWWLADRWEQVCGAELARYPAALRTARLQALANPAPTEPRLLAMSLEVMGRSAGHMVIDTRDHLAAERTRAERRLRGEVALWRFGLVVAASTALLVWLRRLIDWSVPGGSTEHLLALQVSAGMVCAVGAYAALHGVIGALRAWWSLSLGELETAINVLVPTVAGVAGFILYPR
jgi:hypothetical protein